MAKLFEKIDDNPGSYFGMLVEGLEELHTYTVEYEDDTYWTTKHRTEEIVAKSVEEAKDKFWRNHTDAHYPISVYDENGVEYTDVFCESLKESVEDTVSKILSKEVSQPIGFKWLSNNGTSGEVEYNGTKYAFRKLDNGKYKVMPSSKAGWNWSETLFKDESLKEADTIAKPFRKIAKRDYKNFDNRRDLVKNFNDEIEKRLASYRGIKKGSKDYETVKGFLTNIVPKYGKSRKVNSRGLEKNKYPFYVTYYIETPYYHPEDGGYYVAGRHASDSEGFDKKEDAIKVAEEVANDLEMRKISNTEYIKDSKYIGDKAYIFVETEKEYLGKEQGDKQYESLKEDKFVSRDKMSKKYRKELDSKKRNTWGNTNPVARFQPNKKAYDRKRDKKELDEAKHFLYKENADKFREAYEYVQKIADDMLWESKKKEIGYEDALYYYNILKKATKMVYNSFIGDDNYDPYEDGNVVLRG